MTLVKTFKESLINKWKGNEKAKQCLDLHVTNFIDNNLENVLFFYVYIAVW